MARKNTTANKNTQTLNNPNNSINKQETIKTKLINNIQQCDISDIELRVCTQSNEEENYEPDEDYLTEFPYQPGSLWLVFDNSPICIMTSPECTYGMVNNPFETPAESKPVSNDFYYHIYEAYTRVDEELDIPADTVALDEATAQISERFHLQEILLQAFTDKKDKNPLVDIIIQKAEHEFTGESTLEPRNQISGSFNGLEPVQPDGLFSNSLLPDELFQKSSITSTSLDEPLAPLNELLTELDQDTSDEITIVSPNTDQVFNLVYQKVLTTETDMNVILDANGGEEVNNLSHRKGSNHTITTVDQLFISTPIVVTESAAFVMILGGKKNPTDLIKTTNEKIISDLEQYITDLENGTQEVREIPAGANIQGNASKPNNPMRKMNPQSLSKPPWAQ